MKGCDRESVTEKVCEVGGCEGVRGVREQHTNNNSASPRAGALTRPQEFQTSYRERDREN